MNIEQLCMGCMNDAGENSKCPYCGYIEGTIPESPIYLTPRTELSGRYIVGKVLGHGGFGITYLAYDKMKEQKVALKEYFPNNAVSRAIGNPKVITHSGDLGEFFKQGRGKFLEEAKALEKCKIHPGIVTVDNFFHENGTAYMAMEYLDGESLSEYLIRHGRQISFEQALELLRDTFDALEEMHKVNMLHRDIKPSNIFVRKNSKNTVLIDFGSARQFTGQKTQNLSAIVTAGFSPLEQYDINGEQKAWTDVYAIGATLYYMLTSVIPPEAYLRTGMDPFLPLARQGIDVSAHVDAAITKAVAIRSVDRFTSIAAFRKALMGHSVGDEEDQTKAAVYNSVKCQRCNTINNLLKGQTIHNTLCHQCGNPLHQLIPTAQKAKKHKWLIVASVLLLALSGIGGIGYTMWGKQDSVKTQEVVKAQESTTQVASKTENQPSTSNQGMTNQPSDSQINTNTTPSMAANQMPPNDGQSVRSPEKPAVPAVPEVITTKNIASEPAENWVTDSKGTKLSYSGAQSGEVFMYSGGISNGYADGTGKISYFRGGVLQRQLKGNWSKGHLIEGSESVVYQ